MGTPKAAATAAVAESVRANGSRPLDGVGPQNDTTPQVDALQLQTQRAGGPAVQHALQELRGAGRSRGFLHRRALPARFLWWAQECVNPRRTQDLQPRHPREVRREHLGHRGGNAGAFRTRVIPDGPDGQDRESVACSQADHSDKGRDYQDGRGGGQRRRARSPRNLLRGARLEASGPGLETVPLSSARLMFQPLRQRHHLRRRLYLELAPHECLVLPPMLDCFRPLPGVVQGEHQSQGGL